MREDVTGTSDCIKSPMMGEDMVLSVTLVSRTENDQDILDVGKSLKA